MKMLDFFPILPIGSYFSLAQGREFIGQISLYEYVEDSVIRVRIDGLKEIGGAQQILLENYFKEAGYVYEKNFIEK